VFATARIDRCKVPARLPPVVGLRDERAVLPVEYAGRALLREQQAKFVVRADDAGAPPA
jgi:hypothetical protein